jgi:replicative DNA helicase
MFEPSNKSRKKTYTPVATNEIGKLQPQAIELEEAVLGSVLLESEAFDTISSICKVEHFYKEQNGLIFKAILSLASKHEPIDILTVSQELKRTGDLELVGGSYYVSSLTNRIASTANIERHARIVAQMYYKREMILIGTRMIQQAYEDSTDCFDLIDNAANEIASILNDIEVKQALKLSDLRDKVLESCAEAINSDKPSGVPIPHKVMQKHTNGWRNGHLIIVAARPGMGKTAGALEYAYEAAKKGYPTAFFSLEMPATELAGRIMSRESYVSSQKINNNTIDKFELARVINDTYSFDKIPLYIDDTPAMNIIRLRSKAHRLMREKGIKLLVVDYLQLMDGLQNESTREQVVSGISRGLKVLARELNIPIIALSQLSRQVENRPGAAKRPQLSDLRDSGSIEQDADMVIFYYRPEYYGIEVDENNQPTRNLLIKIIAKYRGGQCGDIDAKFYGETMRITDMHPESEEVITEEKPLLGIQNNDNFLSRTDIEETFK